MACHPISIGDSPGILCLGNEPVEIKHGGKSYLFERHPWCGWLPVNKDRSERLLRVPDAVWRKVEQLSTTDTTEDK